MDNIGVFNGAHGAEASASATSSACSGISRRRPSTSNRCAAARPSLSRGGALLADTGIHTGRSPKDKFVVRDAGDRERRLVGEQRRHRRPPLRCACSPTSSRHAEGKELFAQDLYGGADPAYRSRARVFTEFAWHSLFIRNLLHPPGPRRARAASCPDFTIVDLPSFKADPARHGCRSETVIACDF